MRVCTFLQSVFRLLLTGFLILQFVATALCPKPTNTSQQTQANKHKPTMSAAAKRRPRPLTTTTTTTTRKRWNGGSFTGIMSSVTIGSLLSLLLSHRLLSTQEHTIPVSHSFQDIAASSAHNNAQKSKRQLSPTTTRKEDPPPKEPWAACLLLKDNNVLLPEWIAYHYEMMPLRRIIVGLDPTSKTSPQRVLDEFQRVLGIESTIWEYDDYYWPSNHDWDQYYNYTHLHNKTGVYKYPPQDRIWHHRYRQKVLITRCLQTLHTEGWGWTMVLDPDEYIAFNPLAFHEEFPLHCQNITETQFETRTACETYMRQHNFTDPNGVADMRRHVPQEPPATTFSDYLVEHMYLLQQWNSELTRPCWMLPRYSVSSVPNPNPSSDIKGFPSDAFDTLRYHHPGIDTSVMFGKAIVDVRRYQPRALSQVHSALPYEGGCAGKDYPSRNSQTLSVLHYIGRVERFLGRRKPLETFDYRQPYWLNEYVYPLITEQWLERFIQRVGVHATRALTLQLTQEMDDEFQQYYGTYPQPPANWTLKQNTKAYDENVTKAPNFVYDG